MNSISKVRFQDLYEMGSGISSTKEQAGHGAPFVSFSTVFNNYFLPEELPDKMDTSSAEQEACSVKAGDILLTRTSETIDELAMSCVATKDYPNATFSGFLKRLRPKTTGIAYDKYLAFYLRGDLFRRTITNNAFMTLRASFNEDIFSYLYLYLPPYEQQVLMGDLLYKMEQKIQLNKRICAELESMAKTLYDYWFVQFDFTDANGKPYRASGGEMVWNEQLKCEIPKGWVVQPLSYYLYCNKNTIKRNEWNCYIDYLDTGSLTSNQIGELQRYETIEEAPSRAQRIVYPNDILYSTVRPNQCHYGLIKSPSPNLVASSGFACLASKFSAEYNDLFYLFLTSERIVNRLTSIAASSVSAYPSINPSDILEQLIALPEELDSIRGLSNRLCDLLSAVTHYQTESKELTRLRDWLLPMLMNGQATVAPAESAPKLQVLKPEKPAHDPRFDRWLQTQGVAARGTVDEQTLHDIFDAMDDDDKQ